MQNLDECRNDFMHDSQCDTAETAGDILPSGPTMPKGWDLLLLQLSFRKPAAAEAGLVRQ